MFLYLWSKFGDSSCNMWIVIVRTTQGWHTETGMHTHTDAGNNNTWRPKLASDNYKASSSVNLFHCILHDILRVYCSHGFIYIYNYGSSIWNTMSNVKRKLMEGMQRNNVHLTSVLRRLQVTNYHIASLSNSFPPSAAYMRQRIGSV